MKILLQYRQVTYLSALWMECFCNIALRDIELNCCPKVVTILFGNMWSTIIAVILCEYLKVIFVTEYTFNIALILIGNVLKTSIVAILRKYCESIY